MKRRARFLVPLQKLISEGETFREGNKNSGNGKEGTCKEQRKPSILARKFDFGTVFRDPIKMNIRRPFNSRPWQLFLPDKVRDHLSRRGYILDWGDESNPRKLPADDLGNKAVPKCSLYNAESSPVVKPAYLSRPDSLVDTVGSTQEVGIEVVSSPDPSPFTNLGTLGNCVNYNTKSGPPAYSHSSFPSDETSCCGIKHCRRNCVFDYACRRTNADRKPSPSTTVIEVIDCNPRVPILTYPRESNTRRTEERSRPPPPRETETRKTLNIRSLGYSETIYAGTIGTREGHNTGLECTFKNNHSPNGLYLCEALSPTFTEDTDNVTTTLAMLDDDSLLESLPINETSTIINLPDSEHSSDETSQRNIIATEEEVSEPLTSIEGQPTKAEQQKFEFPEIMIRGGSNTKEVQVPMCMGLNENQWKRPHHRPCFPCRMCSFRDAALQTDFKNTWSTRLQNSQPIQPCFRRMYVERGPILKSAPRRYHSTLRITTPIQRNAFPDIISDRVHASNGDFNGSLFS
ncbi:unnamed protein product [Mesocestoides corti]|uniref:Uncharacterized protein n=1 Tax=Mesocestoides corti TaxID=53468 RepID=A0A0R3U215_MESCO|nr:unnamed protein product [Mesocestoides corti]